MPPLTPDPNGSLISLSDADSDSDIEEIHPQLHISEETRRQNREQRRARFNQRGIQDVEEMELDELSDSDVEEVDPPNEIIYISDDEDELVNEQEPIRYIHHHNAHPPPVPRQPNDDVPAAFGAQQRMGMGAYPPAPRVPSPLPPQNHEGFMRNAYNNLRNMLVGQPAENNLPHPDDIMRQQYVPPPPAPGIRLGGGGFVTRHQQHLHNYRGFPNEPRLSGRHDETRRLINSLLEEDAGRFLLPNRHFDDRIIRDANHFNQLFLNLQTPHPQQPLQGLFDDQEEPINLPDAPDYQIEFTHPRKMPKGFTADFSASEVIDLVEEEVVGKGKGRAITPQPQTKKAFQFVCVSCRTPLRSNGEGKRKVHGLRCGHVIDGECLLKFGRPPTQEEEPSTIADIPPSVLSSNPSGYEEVEDPDPNPTLRSRLRPRREVVPTPNPSVNHPYARPLLPKTKGKGGRGRKKKVVDEHFEWACPVPDCGRIHVSSRLMLEGSKWRDNEERGALVMFL